MPFFDPIRIGASGAADTTYAVNRSIRFDPNDTYMERTPSSAGNRRTFTISLWFKLGKSPSTDSAGFWSTSPSNDSGYGGNPSPYNMQFLQFASGAIEIQDYNVSGNHYIMRKRTNRTFEDTSKLEGDLTAGKVCHIRMTDELI